jgi:hypothetical protein
VELQVTIVIRWLALGLALFAGSPPVPASGSSHHVAAAVAPTAGNEADSERLAALAQRIVEGVLAPATDHFVSATPLTSSRRPKAASAPAQTLQPIAAPATAGCNSSACVQALIQQAFAPYGQTGIAWGLRVAACESGYNPNAYNPAGPYYGVFQFLMSTFRATPYGNQNIFDATANVYAAAWKYGQGGASAWGCH